jgi:hypothetical protein
MSSPKRTAKYTAKSAVRRAANAASRERAAPRAPKPQPKAGFKAADGASTDAKRLAAAIERGIAAGELDVLGTDALQALMAAACRIYAARREAGEDFLPVAKHTLTATDVMVAASGLLQAGNLSTFELGMWHGFTGR